MSANNFDDSSSSDTPEGEYTVEAIVKHRQRRNGSYEFFIKWKGYSSDENTWEPLENLAGSQALLDEYWEKIGTTPPDKNESFKSKEDKPKKMKKTKTKKSSEKQGKKESSKEIEKKKETTSYKAATQKETEEPSSQPKSQPKQEEITEISFIKPVPTSFEIIGVFRNSDNELVFGVIENGKRIILNNDIMKKKHLNELIAYYESNIELIEPKKH